MTDEKHQAWGLIQWAMTAGMGVMSFVIGYLCLFLGKKWNKDIDTKIDEYDKLETKLRLLRKEKYGLEINTLNEKIEGLIDKLEGVETEIRGREGILDRIKDAENGINNLKEK